MTDQTRTIDDLAVDQHNFTVLSFFRGEWCPFCQSFSRELNGSFREQVIAAGGQLVGITSQSAEAARSARKNWQLDYDVISDPTTELAKSFGIDITPKAESPLAEHPTEYPNGMSQSGVIVLNRDGQELYNWAVNPAVVNVFGASDRPLPSDVWAAIEAALAGEDEPVQSAGRVDPAFLAANYPEQYAAFAAFAETLPEEVQREMRAVS
ncbi:MAG: redoxin domain-containing protein [Acidimicrobiia bacterium]|nr:redoxin domain-containing protein [Acidimicrobiia bacterium]